MDNELYISSGRTTETKKDRQGMTAWLQSKSTKLTFWFGQAMQVSIVAMMVKQSTKSTREDSNQNGTETQLRVPTHDVHRILPDLV
jgi:hypothetical protein